MAKTPIFDHAAAPPHVKQSLRLWLRMLGTTTIIEKRIRALLKLKCNTTLPRFDVLATLERAGDKITMSQMSERLLVSNGNVTGLVSRLVKDGLVARRVDPNDRRTQFVRLTPKGRKAFRAMAAQHEAWVDEMFDSVPDRDMQTLLRLVTALNHDVHARLKRAQNP